PHIAAGRLTEAAIEFGEEPTEETVQYGTEEPAGRRADEGCENKETGRQGDREIARQPLGDGAIQPWREVFPAQPPANQDKREPRQRRMLLRQLSLLLSLSPCLCVSLSPALVPISSTRHRSQQQRGQRRAQRQRVECGDNRRDGDRQRELAEELPRD